MYRYTKLLASFLLLIGLSALAGGYGLITTNGLGMPLSDLVGTPFSSYIGPGVILALVVGGTHIASAIMLFSKKRCALDSAAIAGFVMLIWIFTEVYMINRNSWLHILYFALGITNLISTMLLLKQESEQV